MKHTEENKQRCLASKRCKCCKQSVTCKNFVPEKNDIFCIECAKEAKATKVKEITDKKEIEKYIKEALKDVDQSIMNNPLIKKVMEELAKT